MICPDILLVEWPDAVKHDLKRLIRKSVFKCEGVAGTDVAAVGMLVSFGPLSTVQIRISTVQIRSATDNSRMDCEYNRLPPVVWF